MMVWPRRVAFMALSFVECCAAWPHASTAMARSVLTEIKRLHSSRWIVRHTAERALLLKSARALPAIDKALARSVKPEITARLRRVGLQLYIEKHLVEGGRRPFLGIRFWVLPQVPTMHGFSAVYVNRVLRGLPAGLVLERGDLIFGINGHYFGPGMTNLDFLQLMSVFRAGSRIELRVLRGNRWFDMHVRLLAVPADDTRFSAWISHRTLLMDRYLHEMRKARAAYRVDASDSPMVFRGKGNHPKS